MGGNAIIDQFPMGRISGSNLTRGKGGVGARYATDEAWARAILHGVGQFLQSRGELGSARRAGFGPV